MRTGGGKAKGSAFERSVCIDLSKWVSGGNARIDLFWRSALSGGRATVKRGTVRQAGDITAVAPEGHVLTDNFYLECKHLKNISLDGLIKGKGALINIWATTVMEALKYNRVPILIFRQNHWPTIFCTNDSGVISFGVQDRCIRATYRSKEYPITLNYTNLTIY